MRMVAVALFVHCEFEVLRQGRRESAV